MTSKRGSKFWEWVGKISVALGVIGGVIFIFQWLYPDTPKLKVRGEYYEWPNIETSLRADLFWRFDIENVGGEITKNVRIDFPFNGRFTLGDASDLKEFNRGSSIQIGDLQPSDKKTLRVWSLGGNLFKNEVYKNDIKIIHDSGIEVVDYPTQVYGAMAWIINNSANSVIILAVTILTILTIKIVDIKKPDRDASQPTS